MNDADRRFEEEWLAMNRRDREDREKRDRQEKWVLLGIIVLVAAGIFWSW